MILTFSNTRTVIRAERELKNHQVFYQVIPTPRQISSECGMCLKISPQDLKKVEELFQKQEIKIAAIVDSEKLAKVPHES